MNYKPAIIAALRAFIEQRPGFEPGNYGSWRDYRNESASVTRDLHDARRLLRELELRESITAEMIIDATRSGRITIGDRPGHVVIDYCTGQYFPVEYRKAVARLCASVLWSWTLKSATPAAPKPSPGDWLRAHFRKEFGPRLGRRYFD